MILSFFLISLVTSSQIVAQESLAVTIYNNDFAMVKDVRSIKFDKGQSVLYFTDVSSNIQTETVTFKALKDPTSIRVYEQNFERNLIDKSSILKKYIQKNIEVVAEFGDQAKRVRGILLAQDGDYILKTGTGVIVLKDIAAIELPSIPDGFFTVPTLNWKVFSDKSQTTSCEVAYRTTGFNWNADYSIVLNNEQNKGDVGGWVTIDNNSGKKYENAKLKLIAGEVNIVQPTPEPYPMYQELMMMDAAPMAMAPAPPTFTQKSFSDYHLYTLSAPVTLNQSSQKQVQFIPKVFGVKLRRFNLISISSGGYGQSNIKSQSKVQFNNSNELGLGIPFPKGTFRVFKQDDSDNSLEFVGQDSINHTPKNQNITLTIGNAFDITTNLYAEERQDFKDGAYFARMNITITNHKNIDATIQLRISVWQADNLKLTWQPTNKAPLIKQSATLYKVIFTLKPDQTVALKWQQSYQF